MMSIIGSLNFKYLPIDFLKDWVKASVLDISSEKISEPANIVNGVSSPKLFAIPILSNEKHKVKHILALYIHLSLEYCREQETLLQKNFYLR